MSNASEPTRPVEIDENDKYLRYCIDEDGNVTVEAFNFHGVGCRAATDRIEARLGTVTSRKDKDDGPGETHQGVSCR